MSLKVEGPTPIPRTNRHSTAKKGLFVPEAALRSSETWKVSKWACVGDLEWRLAVGIPDYGSDGGHGRDSERSAWSVRRDRRLRQQEVPELRPSQIRVSKIKKTTNSNDFITSFQKSDYYLRKKIIFLIS